MRLHFKSVRVAAVALFAATCLSSGAALSQQRVFVFWPHREPMKMEAQSPVEPVEIELSLPTPFALTVGESVALDVSAEGNADGVTYRPAASAVMPGLTVNASTGAVTGTPSAAANTEYDIAVEAVRHGTVVGTTETVQRTLRNPVEFLDVPDDPVFAVGESMPAPILARAKGGDACSIAFALEDAPDWLTLSTQPMCPGHKLALLRKVAGEEITETPPTTVTAVVRDSEGREARADFTVEARDFGIAFAVPSPFALTTGQSVSLALASPVDLDGVTYQAGSGAVMDGLTVNATTGTVTGTPNVVAGTAYHITVDAVRGYNDDVIASTSIERTLRDPLAVATVPSGLELTVGDVFPMEGMEIAVSGGDLATVSWSLEDAPAWLTIEETGDGTAVLKQAEGEEITETAATTVTVIAKDGEGRETSAEVAVEVSAAATNVAPEVSVTSGTTNYVSGTGPVVIDGGVTVSDIDSLMLASATVAIVENFVSDEDVLGFEPSSWTGDISASFDAASGVLTLTSPEGSATLAQWSTALSSVTYSNVSPTPHSSLRTVSFTVSDGFDLSEAATDSVQVLVPPA
jgi:hypothetical protein